MGRSLLTIQAQSREASRFRQDLSTFAKETSEQPPNLAGRRSEQAVDLLNALRIILCDISARAIRAGFSPFSVRITVSLEGPNSDPLAPLGSAATKLPPP